LYQEKIIKKSVAKIPLTHNILFAILSPSKMYEFVKSLLKRHPGESRGPELIEITGFRLSPE